MSLEALVMTPRDRQVVALLLQGCASTEIGESLGITPRTVKQHLRNIYLRMGIRQGAKRIHLLNLISVSSQKSPLPTELSPRERQVAEATLEGMTNPEIAVRLGTSEQMIKNYLRSVYDKCGVWSRIELAARYRCA